MTNMLEQAKEFRQKIYDLIENSGYDPVDPRHFQVAQCMDQPIFAKNCPCGEDYYHRPRTCNFVLYDADLHPDLLIIESRWQSKSGTVDEKFPFLVETIAASAIDTLIVLDGDGYSDEAEQWLRHQAGKRHLLHVLNMNEFQSYVNDQKL